MSGYRLDKSTLVRDWPVFLLLAATFAVSAWAYPFLPERVPVHWNAAGQVDGYGSRLMGAFFLPGLALGLYVLMLVLPLADPRKAVYGEFLGSYRVIRGSTAAFMSIMQFALLASALGFPVPMDRLTPFCLGLLCLALGRTLPGIRFNYFVGIRTPWTLASEEVWARTHRLGGTLFIVAGSISIAAALFLRGAPVLYSSMSALMGAAVVSAAYSLVIFLRGQRSG